ncbi:MAG: hypothetical protein IKB42_05550 [Clostridia bacterium]|nr:hypothetical protein [Clostridia bacterium]
MQLKLLNFHKMLANFSTSLVGGFIPLIIYRQTNSLFWSIFYLFAMYILYFIFNQIFREQYVKRPQLFLVLRAVPILIYSVAVVLIDISFIVGVILVAIFYALNLSFRGNATEIILNYSVSQNTDSKSLGLTRVFEQIGTIVAMIAGGLFLDYLPTYVLIIIAMSIYLLSTVPLLMYYISARKQKGFNTEMTSNALVQFAQNPDKSQKGKKVSRQVLFRYGLVYYLVGFLDIFCDTFNIFMYVKTGQFAWAGYFSALYNAAFAVGSYINGFLTARFDTTKLAAASLIINGISVVVVACASSTIVQLIMFGIIGFVYPYYSLFLLERMLSKTRILGVSNRAIFMRDDATQLGRATCLIVALFGFIIPTFTVMGTALVSCGLFAPVNEEQTRKTMIDYLEGSN